ncbi:Enamine/imine deaminase [Tepidanaerobacter acetatoxydans Re1]|uniref:Enamine/imine deaminase n=1 Tax=Tepidanaerobacter acetatoxydans (strain DSM 21804 / JCM 16047 / Re1) TaxID=1209989 RepID=F4LSA7_TEPAE|nr:RidA family protein [Tepidanaerobacter acetatoxydans]AEE90370.1 endoribonuclease L-PSP [Tepidanaerobacter acetatoxydans Re1]CCP24862.1 Enamine/imine deaminase [Tepidanaerobacter acetatoxydans Re1]
MKKVINTNLAPKAIGPYSQAIMLEDLLFASGQIAIDPKKGEIVEGGIEAQTSQVMENIKNILSAAEMDFSNIIKTTIFLTDLNNFSLVNDIYGGYFTKEPPARSCVEVSRLPKGALIEIEVIAQK